MSMVQLGKLTAPNPFHRFICDGCGKTLGRHWVFRPDRLGDVIANATGRKPTGKFYCHSDQCGHAGAHHQRELRRTMAAGFRA
jgi:hypothetical protein